MDLTTKHRDGSMILAISDPDLRDPDPDHDLGIRAHVCKTYYKKLSTSTMGNKQRSGE